MKTSLTTGQRWLLGAAIVLVVGGMVIGFWSSYETLYRAALAHGWENPQLLPLGVDTGIVAYVLLDHLAVILGSRSRWLHLVAWSLAAFTVWANAAVGSSTGIWRVIHGAMPSLWVLGVEALRFIWRQLRKGHAPVRDRVPASRWLANPFTAVWLQRRMWMLNESSWPRMALIEDARLLARDLTRAARQVAGVAPPPMLTARIRSGRLPGPVLAAVAADLAAGTSTAEAAVHVWVRSQLTLPDRVAANLQTDRLAIAQAVPTRPSETSAPAPAETLPPAAPEPVRLPTRKAARPGGRKPRLDPAEAARVRAWVEGRPEGSAPSIGAVMLACRVGRPAARTMLAEAKPAPIHAVR